ncbi:MAG: hypothetical protein SGPRY_013684, partial [Prymnesium sp.]
PPTAWCVGPDGKFSVVGGLALALHACGESAPLVDLKQAVVLPGFIDSHLHLLYGGHQLARPSLALCTSPADVVSTLQAFLADHPLPAGAWLQGFGWDQERFTSRRFPSRADLDPAFPHTPLFLTRIDGHAAWVNSAALRLAPPLPSYDPRGGTIRRDSSGQPTGILTDSAMPLIAAHIPPPTYAQATEALSLATGLLSRHGVTSIHDPGIGLEEVPLLLDAIDNGSFPIRSYAMYLANGADGGERLARPDSPKLENYKGRLSVKAVKFFLDGALGSRGAALLSNYSDRPSQRGELRLNESSFTKRAEEWIRAGWQVATHAIGDRANRIVLGVYERACATVSQPADLRLRIEHFQIVNSSDASQACHQLFLHSSVVVNP